LFGTAHVIEIKIMYSTLNEVCFAYMPKSHVFKTKLVLFSVQIFQNLHYTYLGDQFVGMHKLSFPSTIIYQCNVNLIVKFIREVPRMGFF
jgi:hypothetical protein